jgi:Domain of unknown function (DUF4439)
VAADPSRRAVLAAAAAPLLVVGCKGIGALGPLPQPSPDVRTLDHAIAAEELMIARYQAAVTALAGRGSPTTTVAALLAQHQLHLVRLKGQLVLPPRLATARPSPSPSPPSVPAAHAHLLAGLAQAERAAAAALASELSRVPPALAQLMASISASEAAHAELLSKTRQPAGDTHGAAGQGTSAGAAPPGGPADGRPALAALQTALAAEQAASYGYGVVGAHLTGTKFALATTYWIAHQRERDKLTAMIAALGARPHPAAVAYQLPGQIRSAAQAVSLAALIEHQVAAAYLPLVAQPDQALRQLAARRMQTAAIWATRWNGRPQAFPGLPRPARRR